MKRKAMLAAILTAMLATGCRSGRGEQDAGDPAEVRAVLEAQQEAWNAGDLDGFMKGYWRDGELTFYSGDKVEKGYEELEERYRKRYQKEGKKSMGRLTFSELDVRLTGGGWATARGRWKVERPGADGKEETLQGLFTLVLRRFPEGWRIVHDHTSAAEKKAG